MALTHEEAHELARTKGVSRPLYAVVRGVVVPTMRVWFRLRISGAENIPADGPVIVVPNHKSFADSFFVGAATRRHVRFMGKKELFEGRWGRTLIRLGAFPVRRGQSDEEALETARAILRDGGLLALFPEGTRIRDADELGEPRRGAGRLALETGAPLVPAAISGTEDLRRGPLVLPRKVQVAFAEPIPVGSLEATPEAAAELVQESVWPEVERRFRRLRARHGLAAAGLAAAGLGGGLAARQVRARHKKPWWQRALRRR